MVYFVLPPIWYKMYFRSLNPSSLGWKQAASKEEQFWCVSQYPLHPYVMLNLSIFTLFPPKLQTFLYRRYAEGASGVLSPFYQKVLMICQPHSRSSMSRLLAPTIFKYYQNSLSARPSKCSETSKLTQQDLGVLKIRKSCPSKCSSWEMQHRVKEN